MKRLILLLLILLPSLSFAGGLSGTVAFNISSAVEGTCIDITGGTTINVDEACNPSWSGQHNFVGAAPQIQLGDGAAIAGQMQVGDGAANADAIKIEGATETIQWKDPNVAFKLMPVPGTASA